MKVLPMMMGMIPTVILKMMMNLSWEILQIILKILIKTTKILKMNKGKEYPFERTRIIPFY